MFWKISFYINLVLIALTLAVYLFFAVSYPEFTDQGQSLNPNEIITLGTSIVGVVAMFGLAYDKNILSRGFWLFWFSVVIVNDILYPHIPFLYKLSDSDITAGITSFVPMLTAHFLGVCWSLLFATALYKLSNKQNRYRSDKIT